MYDNIKPPSTRDVEAIVDKIRPLLANQGPALQGAVLAVLTGTWAAGHSPNLREDVLELQDTNVRKLVMAEASEVGNRNGMTNWRGPNILPSPKDYAIEFGEYLATAAKHFLTCTNAMAKAEAAGASAVEMDKVYQSAAEAWLALDSAIYEFRKRATRAGHKPSAAMFNR